MKFVDLETQYRRYKEEIDRRMAAVIATQAFIMGPQIAELESALATYVGARHAIGVASGTDALLVALMAAGIGPGDEVITSPFTFIATAEVIALVGARPVFADIDPVTYNLDPAAAKRCLSPRTRAIIPVSLYGQCADMEAFNALAASHGGVTVIEDACQSFGASRNGRRSCGLSAVGCTSFFPSKPLGAWGDGGMIFTSDDTLAARMRQIMVHGQERRYHHVRIGVNARLDTLQAAVLLGKWPHFEAEMAARERNGALYNQRLEGVPGVVLPVTLTGNTHVFAQYSIQVPGRDALGSALSAEGIPTAVHYPVPLHLQPAFGSLGLGQGSFPVSEGVAGRIISLPMHPFLTEGEIDLIAVVVRRFLTGTGA